MCPTGPQPNRLQSAQDIRKALDLLAGDRMIRRFVSHSQVAVNAIHNDAAQRLTFARQGNGLFRQHAQPPKTGIHLEMNVNLPAERAGTLREQFGRIKAVQRQRDAGSYGFVHLGRRDHAKNQ